MAVAWPGNLRHVTGNTLKTSTHWIKDSGGSVDELTFNIRD